MIHYDNSIAINLSCLLSQRVWARLSPVRNKSCACVTTKAIAVTATLAKRTSDLQGEACPSEDLATLDQYIFPLVRSERSTRGGGVKRNTVSAHYSLRIRSHLPFNMHIYFISALRCHKLKQLNAKGPLIWAMAGEPNSFLWFICGGTRRRKKSRFLLQHWISHNSQTGALFSTDLMHTGLSHLSVNCDLIWNTCWARSFDYVPVGTNTNGAGWESKTNDWWKEVWWRDGKEKWQTGGGNKEWNERSNPHLDDHETLRKYGGTPHVFDARYLHTCLNGPGWLMESPTTFIYIFRSWIFLKEDLS